MIFMFFQGKTEKIYNSSWIKFILPLLNIVFLQCLMILWISALSLDAQWLSASFQFRTGFCITTYHCGRSCIHTVAHTHTKTFAWCSASSDFYAVCIQRAQLWNTILLLLHFIFDYTLWNPIIIVFLESHL